MAEPHLQRQVRAQFDGILDIPRAVEAAPSQLIGAGNHLKTARVPTRNVCRLAKLACPNRREAEFSLSCSRWNHTPAVIWCLPRLNCQASVAVNRLRRFQTLAALFGPAAVIVVPPLRRLRRRQPRCCPVPRLSQRTCLRGNVSPWGRVIRECSARKPAVSVLSMPGEKMRVSCTLATWFAAVSRSLKNSGSASGIRLFSSSTVYSGKGCRGRAWCSPCASVPKSSRIFDLDCCKETPCR